MVKPVLLYGCEAWALTGTLENRLCVFENRIPSKIRPNREIRELSSLPSVVADFRTRRLRLAGHVARSDETRTTKAELLAEPYCSRPLGRPRLRWSDSVKKDSAEFGVVSWKIVAHDRDRWRGLIKATLGLQGL